MWAVDLVGGWVTPPINTPSSSSSDGSTLPSYPRLRILSNTLRARA